MVGQAPRRARLGPIGAMPALVALLALVALALVACTSGAAGNGNGVLSLSSADPGSSAAPSASMSPQDAAVAFAHCMREHGVDVPDPQFDENGGKVAFGFQVGGAKADKQKMEAAQQACQHFLDAATFARGNGGQIDQETQDKLLAFARCMRDHGIDFPDPQFENGGIAKIGGDSGPKFDPNSKAFQDAQQACQSLAPGGPDGGPKFQTNQDGGGSGTDEGGASTGSQP